MGYPHPWVADRLASGSTMVSYPLDHSRVAMLCGEFSGSRMVADGLPEQTRLDRRTVADMVRGLTSLDQPFALAAVNERTVYLATNALSLFFWAPFEHTVYFCSSLAQIDAVLPFGQGAVALQPGTAMDLTTQEVARW
jgi:hypothetical protein